MQGDCRELDNDSTSVEGQSCMGSWYLWDILGEVGCLHKCTEKVTPEIQ